MHIGISLAWPDLCASVAYRCTDVKWSGDIKYHYLFCWNVNYLLKTSQCMCIYDSASTSSAMNAVICIVCGLKMTETPKI